MHRRGDVLLEIGFITAAVELFAKINQDKPVVTKLPIQPGRVDERYCRRLAADAGTSGGIGKPVAPVKRIAKLARTGKL